MPTAGNKYPIGRMSLFQILPMIRKFEQNNQMNSWNYLKSKSDQNKPDTHTPLEWKPSITEIQVKY